MPRKILYGTDHTAFDFRDEIIQMIKEAEPDAEVEYLGPDGGESSDYPDFAAKVAGGVSRGEAPVGILICGSGIGMSISANKFSGIRAALCHDHLTTWLARQHNDANVLCMGIRTSGIEVIREMITTFLTTEFSKGAHHERRIQKIKSLDEMDANAQYC